MAVVGSGLVGMLVYVGLFTPTPGAQFLPPMR